MDPNHTKKSICSRATSSNGIKNLRKEAPRRSLSGNISIVLDNH
jgi:hypothetical protein